MARTHLSYLHSIEEKTNKLEEVVEILQWIISLLVIFMIFEFAWFMFGGTQAREDLKLIREKVLEISMELPGTDDNIKKIDQSIINESQVEAERYNNLKSIFETGTGINIQETKNNIQALHYFVEFTVCSLESKPTYIKADFYGINPYINRGELISGLGEYGNIPIEKPYDSQLCDMKILKVVR